MADGTSIFTIGHSNHPIELFLRLLDQASIQVISDVRSRPYARYATQFNRDFLEPALTEGGFRYVFMGDQLGGRPAGTEFYDEEGHVRYDRLARSPAFGTGIARLREGVRSYRVAIMCSEEDPMNCHRRLLVGRVLRDSGLHVLHLRSDGSQEDERAVARREMIEHPDRYRLPMFQSEESEWRSIRSVSGATARPNSSER
jgi:uncharacterized protein (DUF488 family)